MSIYADGGGDEFYKIVLLPDNKQVVLETFNGSFQIRRLTDGALLFSAPEKNKIGQTNIFIQKFSFNPKQKTLAVLYTSGLVEIYDTERLQLLDKISGHVAAYNSVAISPALKRNGYYLATGASDSTLRIWNIPEGKRAVDIQAEVNSVSFSPKGDYLAFGTRDWTINLLSLQEGSLLSSQSGHLNWVNSLGFSPDGQTLFSGSDDCTIGIWRIKNGLTLVDQIMVQDQSESNWGQIKQISISPDGAFVIGNGHSKVLLYDVKTRETRVLPDIFGYVAFSPDNRSFAATDGKSLSVRNLETLGKSGESEELNGRGVIYSPDGNLLAVGTEEGKILLVDAQSLKIVRELKGHRDEITQLNFSPDGKLLASASQDGTVRLWGIPR